MWSASVAGAGHSSQVGCAARNSARRSGQFVDVPYPRCALVPRARSARSSHSTQRPRRIARPGHRGVRHGPRGASGTGNKKVGTVRHGAALSRNRASDCSQVPLAQGRGSLSRRARGRGLRPKWILFPLNDRYSVLRRRRQTLPHFELFNHGKLDAAQPRR